MSAQYWNHMLYLIVNPKVGLQDISSMYLTLENPYAYILYVYYLRIKLTEFCIVPSNIKGSMAAINITMDYSSKIH